MAHRSLPLSTVVCEQQFMKRSRIWFGTLIIVVPVFLAMLLFVPGVPLTHSGPVAGMVIYQGRPLAGGSILFVPEDTKHSEWAHAWIDENGRYWIGRDWRRSLSGGKARFRICVIPNSHKASDGAPRGRDGQAVTAWSGTGDVALPAPAAASGFPQNVSDPRTTQLEVQLGSEPARIDVAL
jgi:hypothetical protein